MSKPTIVLVPGCWYPVATFDKLVAALESRGYKAVVVALPSSTSNSPDATFLDDITAVRTAIEAETSAGRDVVVAAHSYGGLPAHSGSKGLTVGSPEPTSSGGKVVGFVLMASGFTMTGMCFLDPTGGVPPPQWKANKETGFAELLVDPVDMFFHDLPAEEGKMWASKRPAPGDAADDHWHGRQCQRDGARARGEPLAHAQHARGDGRHHRRGGHPV